MSATDTRDRDLKFIHATKRQLGLDDEQYRDLLQQWVGVRSAKDLTAPQRREVRAQLRRLAATRNPGQAQRDYPGKPKNFADEPMLAKIEAQLADMKLPWSYADAIAKQQTGIARVAWLRKRQHLDAIIAALNVEQIKRRDLAKVQKLLGYIGSTEEELAARLKLKKGWQRNRRTLAHLIDYLEEGTGDV